MKPVEDDDKHYLCYEALMRVAPEKLLEAPEYKDLAARYPHIAKSVELRKDIERLKEKARSAEDGWTKLQVMRQTRRLNGQLKRQDVLKRLHGENRQEARFQTRYTITKLRRRLYSLALRVRKVCQDSLSAARLNLQEKLREQSLRSRRARIERLPPSLYDLRSIDPVDKRLALAEWIEKRRVRIR